MEKRACDACRRRKRKCDALVSQCSNCRMAGLVCAYTDSPKKRGPKPFRRLESRQSPEQARSLVRQDDRPGHDLTEVVPRMDRPPVADASLATIPLHAGSTQLHVGSSPSSTIIPTTLSINQAAHVIRARLISSLDTLLPGFSLEEVLDNLISIHMQYVFPSAPMHSETLLRSNTSLAICGACAVQCAPTLQESSHNEEETSMASVGVFTLVTAVCAAAAFLVPESLFPQGPLVAPLLFHASWEMMKLYEDYDLEHPDPRSLSIRLFQSSCLRAISKARSSWHVLCQGHLLAQDLGPFDKESLSTLDPPDALLRRRGFWTILTCSRSATVLADHAAARYREFLDGGFEPHFIGNEKVSLLDQSKRHNQPPFEARLLQGTDLCRRLWAAGFDIIFAIKTFDQTTQTNISPNTRQKTVVDLKESYLEFTQLLDSMPPWLKRPDIILEEDVEVSRYQIPCFWSQRSDLLLTFHSLKLIILHQCIERGVPAALGLSDDTLMLSFRKLELCQEFLNVIEGIPLLNLQFHGEPCVEKIRQAGVLLLQLIEKAENHRIQDLSRAWHSWLTIPNVDSYYGIRYARSPSGDLRWTPPILLDPRQEQESLVNATTYGPACIQSQPPWQPGSSTITESEDCLLLNVQTPIHIIGKLPVLVNIHGGGYVGGSTVPGDSMAYHAKGQMIYVAIQYRLGALGFLGGQDFTSNDTWNAGLLDQRLALDWIKQNIGCFGGDPEKVTITGGSAGGGSVTMQMILYGGEEQAPFRAAIPEYPWWTPMYSSSWVDKQYKGLLAAANCSGLTCLRSVPVDQLKGAIDLATNIAYSAGDFAYGTFYWGPAIDGQIIRGYPIDAFHLGQFTKVPVLVDHDGYEGFYFTNSSLSTEQQLEADLQTLWQEADPAFIQSALQEYSLTQYNASLMSGLRILGALEAAIGQNFTFTDSYARRHAIFGDVVINCPTSYLAEAAAEAGQDSYKMIFNAGLQVHGATAPFLFSDSILPYGLASIGPAVDEGNATLAAFLRDYFVSFTLHLDPNQFSYWTLPPKWPKYTLDHKDILQVEPTSMSGKSDEDDSPQCAFFKAAPRKFTGI
ncbi:hypothetical protein V499_00797 [Pseudogymnoascus sp. VKM F-103]|nr:hypothetical protein V499_00797 [Pseudogymnoascus sp. VKM F-103]